MAEGEVVPGSIYIYAPNKGAPIFFAVAFAVVGVLHLWRMRRHGDWKLTVLHPLCCLMFTVGFVLREYGAFNYIYTKTNLDIYVTSTCFIYMSPPLLELANFHILGRILYYVPYHAPLHPGRVLTTFGCLSGLVENLNAAGVSYLADTTLPHTLTNLGNILLKAGLVLQLAVIALFLLCAGVFHHRCSTGGGGAILTQSNRVRTPLLLLYASTALVAARTVFRTVEYFGFDHAALRSVEALRTGPVVLRYEWFFYVFEATLMLVNEGLWEWWHPRKYLPGSNRVVLERDGVTETEGEGWEDGRPKWVTFLDPFGWFSGAKSGTGSVVRLVRGKWRK